MSADLGVIGLGVMGSSLARNFHSRGRTVAVYNREEDMLADFVQNHGDARFSSHADLGPFVAALARPRVIVMMITAGRPVDMVIEGLLPFLEPGDIVVDGGNSHFDDTERRVAYLKDKQLRFVGMGVSGGEEGALLGPSMMPGGDEGAWATIEPLMTEAAAIA
ncbi:MAG: NAD(P)-binding domain-containing protein, partial [Myxococcota bacterium]